MGDNRDEPSYRLARQAAALTLVGVVSLAVTIDAFGGHQVEPLIMSALLGTSAGLLGIELFSRPGSDR